MSTEIKIKGAVKGTNIEIFLNRLSSYFVLHEDYISPGKFSSVDCWGFSGWSTKTVEALIEEFIAELQIEGEITFMECDWGTSVRVEFREGNYRVYDPA